MIISRKWLEQFVDLSGISDDDIAARLTMLGIEVESFENLSEKYKGFVVGEVLEVSEHPNADRLRLCKVDVGSGIKNIICGAPNVQHGQKVPVGLIGAVVPHNQHDPDGTPFELTKIKIRGVESEGMICSVYELGVGDDRNGIMVLNSDAEVGEPLADYLGLNDTLFEVSLTPNRADCLSHLGIARELASAFGKKIKSRRTIFRESEEDVSVLAKVEVADFDLCPRYSARVIKNIKVGSSPQWLKSALEKVGMRTINNVVDATNYVMLELGQPLHAFDLDLLKKKRIVVRTAKTEEKTFITLDGKERSITSDMLVICDDEKIIALAGIMGGLNSEINSETRNILIESANFSPISIRRTSKALGLSTEASYRFERGVDPNLTLPALDRVAEIIVETAGGEVAKGIIDLASQKFVPKKIELHVENVNGLLGTRLASGEIRRLLESIEIRCDKKNETVLNCWVPTFRRDIEREVDLIEEVARLYGYEKIDESVQAKVILDSRFKDDKSESDIRNFLVGAGFNEIVTNSLQSLSGEKKPEKFVKLANPISEDMAAMRTTMLPSTLRVIKTNLSFGAKNMKLFEIGKVYSLGGMKQMTGLSTEKHHFSQNFVEQRVISLSLVGEADPLSYDRKAFQFDIFDVKSELNRLFAYLNLDSWDFISYDSSDEYEQSLKVFVNDTEVGVIGKVGKETLSRFDIDANVYFAQLNVVDLVSKGGGYKRYHPVSKFPFASIDLAFIVDVATPVGELIKALKDIDFNMVRDVAVFDIYCGEGIPEGKKSVAFNLTLGNDERTLTDGDIGRFIKLSEESLGRRFSAILRKRQHFAEESPENKGD
jgi:phenylalanyl-tRNA synthetase beta chain